MDAIERHALDEIQKSGFPTEIKVHKKLTQKKWNVISQPPFIDQDSKQLRSIDFIAIKTTLNLQNYVNHKSVILYIECKKAEDGGLVFYTVNESEDVINMLSKYIMKFQHQLPEMIKNIQNNKDINKINNKGLFQITDDKILKNRRSISYTSLGKHKDTFYDAQIQLLKYIDKIPDMSPLITQKNSIVYPIIVYDGNLFECDIDNDEVIINKTNYIKFFSSGIPEKPYPTIIQVVTLDFFEKFLGDIESQYNQL